MIKCHLCCHNSDSEMLADLHDQLDEIRDLLVVADKLVTMSVKKPLNYLKRIVSEPENVKQLLTQFTRSAGRRFLCSGVPSFIRNSYTVYMYG